MRTRRNSKGRADAGVRRCSRPGQVSRSVRLKVYGGLLDVAKVMRVLKRHSISRSAVSLGRDGVGEYATVLGTLQSMRGTRSLARALSRIPSVLEAVITGDGDVPLAHYLGPSSRITNYNVREIQ